MSDITDKGIRSNIKIWEAVKPLFTNKSSLSNNDIMLLDKAEILTKDKTLVKQFNNHFINIVEKCGEIKPNV